MIGRRMIHLAHTSSTMDDVSRLMRDGEPEGVVVTADEQSTGRGRHNRRWVSQAGDDLLLSVGLTPRPAIAPELQALSSLAVANVVGAECHVEAKIKWPNDVRVGGAKVAGILTEASQLPDRFTVVIGIGINVNSQPSHFDLGGVEAASMRELTGRSLNRDQVVKSLIGEMDRMYASVSAGATIIPEWRERLETLGQQVEVTFRPQSAESRIIAGIAEDVDQFGRLMIRDESGRVWPVSAGEVTLQRNSPDK